MIPPTPETLTLNEAREICRMLHDKHEMLLRELGPCGLLGAQLIDDFKDALRVMKTHIDAIKALRERIAAMNGDIETKREICALARVHLS